MKHTINAQEAFYSLDVQKIYDKTMELVKENKYWEKKWETIADWLQNETSNHSTFEQAVAQVRRRMGKCGGD